MNICNHFCTKKKSTEKLSHFIYESVFISKKTLTFNVFISNRKKLFTTLGSLD